MYNRLYILFLFLFSSGKIQLKNISIFAGSKQEMTSTIKNKKQLKRSETHDRQQLF